MADLNTHSRSFAAPPMVLAGIDGVDDNHDDVAEEGEEHGDREPLQQQLARLAPAQQVFCVILLFLLLIVCFLWERLPSGPVEGWSVTWVLAMSETTTHPRTSFSGRELVLLAVRMLKAVKAMR